MNFVTHDVLVSFSFLGGDNHLLPSSFGQGAATIFSFSVPSLFLHLWSIGGGAANRRPSKAKNVPLDIARIMSRGEVLEIYSPHHIKE